MTLEEYARQQQQTAAQAQSSGTAPIAQKQATEQQTLQQIIKETSINRQITKGCKLQILKGISEKENPYKLLLTAAEALGRACNQGDSFYIQVQQAIIKAHGCDVSEQ